MKEFIYGIEDNESDESEAFIGWIPFAYREERRMKEFIYGIEDNESDGSEVFIGWIRKQGHELIRCRGCKWFGNTGCAISIVDDTDKPSENDYCSFAERREE